MRRIILIASLAAMVMVLFSAVPALAQQNNDRDHRGDRFQNRVERFGDDGFFFDRFDRFDNGSGISQRSEQEANSGDVDQSFDVLGWGDNSNQTVGLQGVANTGNAQNQIGITQTGSDVDNNNWWDNNWWNNSNGFSDFDFEDSGASIEVSPINTTTSDQEVNQGASAFGR
jgi:hypothetical protein